MAYLMPPRVAFEPRGGLLEVPVDLEQPRVARIGLKSRSRHYVNPARTERRLSRLLADFKWNRVDRVFSKEFKAIARSNAGDFTAGLAPGCATASGVTRRVEAFFRKGSTEP